MEIYRGKQKPRDVKRLRCKQLASCFNVRPAKCRRATVTSLKIYYVHHHWFKKKNLKFDLILAHRFIPSFKWSEFCFSQLSRRSLKKLPNFESHVLSNWWSEHPLRAAYGYQFFYTHPFFSSLLKSLLCYTIYHSLIKLKSLYISKN